MASLANSSKNWVKSTNLFSNYAKNHRRKENFQIHCMRPVFSWKQNQRKTPLKKRTIHQYPLRTQMQKSSLKYEVTKYNNTFKTIIYHSQGGFIPGIARVIQYLQNNVLHHINKTMDKIPMTDSFQKLQHSLVIKTLNKVDLEEAYPNIIKTNMKNPQLLSISTGKIWQLFP